MGFKPTPETEKPVCTALPMPDDTGQQVANPQGEAGLVRKVGAPSETQEGTRVLGETRGLAWGMLSLLLVQDLFQRQKHFACGFALYHVEEGIIDLLELKHSSRVRLEAALLAVLES